VSNDLYTRLKARQFYHKDDEDDFELCQAHNHLLREAVASPPPVYPGTPGTRGIVTAVGGTLYFKCAYVGVKLLRKLGCTLPIEWWHLGEHEFDPEMVKLAEDLGVRVVDANTVDYKPRILNGWELKPFAVAHSKFQEVMFLDADNLSVKDPTPLFDCDEYKRTGSLFWPDLPPSDRPEWVPTEVWRQLGLTRPDTPAFESGQFLINKGKCAKELGVTVHINEYSDWYYKWATYGDKDTFQIAWRMCGTDYGMIRTPCGWDAPAIQQYDDKGELQFQHLCQGKNQLATGQFIPSLKHSLDVSKFAFLLADAWHGKIWKYRDDVGLTKEALQKFEGQWTVRRTDSGASYDIVLLPGGDVGSGRTNAEYSWSVRHKDGDRPELIITGSGHKGTQVATVIAKEGLNRVWRGKSVIHLSREPQARVMPFYWSYRPETYDWGIFNSVATQDEYGLRGMFLNGGCVLDVGAHIGSFSYKVRQVGAGVTHAYEPEPDNYGLLAQNAQFVGCKTFNEAVWSKDGVVRLEKSRCNNTGANYTFEDDAGTTWCVGLDTAIDRLLRHSGQDRVALLKLDCERAEFEILPNADLSRVDRIVAETHDAVRVADLCRYLTGCGFEVNYKHTAGDLGILSARRN